MINEPDKKKASKVEQVFASEFERLIAEHSVESSAFFVAFSGGMDSCVLLDLIAKYVHKNPNMQLCALHYDHGLQEESKKWQVFAAKIAKTLHISFESHEGKVSVDRSKGLEASARKARYEWFAERMEKVNGEIGGTRDAILLTAHHCDDQTETILMNILRGTGIKGLRGIAPYKRVDSYFLYRPLLELTKSELIAYALRHQLKWIEDPSNTDTYYKRNAIRHNVLPQLIELNPNASKQFMKLSHRIADSETILHEVATSDLSLTDLIGFCPLDQSYGLSFKGLQHLSVSRQLNAIRYWLDHVKFPAESEMDLLKVLDWSINGTTANAELRRGYRVYRYYQDALYVMPSDPIILEVDEIIWRDSSVPLRINLGQLDIQCKQMEGESYCNLHVKQRDDSDSIFLSNGAGHINPKNCLQDAAVPPWRRKTALFISDENNCFITVLGGLNAKQFELSAL